MESDYGLIGKGEDNFFFFRISLFKKRKSSCLYCRIFFFGSEGKKRAIIFIGKKVMENLMLDNISARKGEIVIYQPDEVTKLEVMVESETVWLTQEQIAVLFGVKRPAITKHIKNIYNCGELEERSTCSILEHMGNDGVSSGV